ncbi:MAG: nickel pincer cofactor biosynthesis protein LarB [Acidimicrobiia bacterium]|nr:MAG: nickel pincer cofactor biosynthesis protein LarB [Acidimicrobiia bacterium]
MGWPTMISDGEHKSHRSDIRLDLDRNRRIGIPEAVYAEGKTPDQCVEIVTTLLADSDSPIIVTRATSRNLAVLAHMEPTATLGTTLTWRHAAVRDVTPVSVVSGGVSDQPTVDECVATLTAMGVPVKTHCDVGVAGLHRLVDVVPDLAAAEVVVAVAGMEASLPTVLAGLVAAPIIGVPTSAGYGSSLEGVTAMLSMLASCAPGITIVGIDNGYGAACAALRIVGIDR